MAGRAVRVVVRWFLAGRHGPGPARTVAGETELRNRAGVDHVAPVRDAGQVRGALTLRAQEGRDLALPDVRLAAEMANAAGLLLRHDDLTEQLRQQLRLETAQAAELAASRRRVVVARDAAREQLSAEIQARVCAPLERCAGQIAVLGLDEPADAALAAGLAEMSREIDAAIADFRRIVHGVYPPVLTDHGLRAAMESLLTDVNPQGALVSHRIPRLAARVEAGAYFCAAALLREWDGSRASRPMQVLVGVTTSRILMTFADGVAQGSERPALPVSPLVYESVQDRVAALGGSMAVDGDESRPAAGDRGAADHGRPHRPGATMSKSNRQDIAWYTFTALYCAFVLGWLLVGLAAALTAHLSAVHDWAQAAMTGRYGTAWASTGRGLLAGAGIRESYPPVEVWLDYLFSAVNLLFAAILFRLARRDWTVRFLVIGMVGAAGAFNLQAHTSIEAIQKIAGVNIDLWHVALLHGVGGVAYVFALLLFPTGTLDWGGQRNWPVRVLLVTSIGGAAALLSVAAAEASHTISFVLFFGLLTPVAGVTAQLVRSAGPPARAPGSSPGCCYGRWGCRSPPRSCSS